MSNEKIRDPGVWASGVPPTGPIGTSECLGYWFELDAPGWLEGFSVYQSTGHPRFALFQLWDTTSTLIAQELRTQEETARTPVADNWRVTWCHPRVALAASTPYLLSCTLTEWYVDFGRLMSAPVVSGHITVYQWGTSPNPGNGVYDPEADSGTRFSLLSPPNSPVAGHLYGLDMLIAFDP